MKVVHKDVYLIDVPKKGRFHPVFHISVLKKFTPDEGQFHPDQQLRPKPSYGIWEKTLGQVNGIVGKKRLSQGLVYQCTFEGYPVTEYQWVSVNYLRHVRPLIEAFEARGGGQDEKDKRGIKRKTPKR